MSSSPLLLDFQTSVSPILSSASQPSQQPATPTLTQTAAESSSPIALAPGSAAQSEAPTPTLVPKGSLPKPALRQSPADASPATSPASPQGSPRDILSSLQQMNLQSRPFNFAQDTSESLSDAAREQTPEPFYVSSPGHADIEQTPEQSQELQGYDAIRTEATDERIKPIAAEQSEEVNNEEEQHGEGEKGEDQPVGYISRRTTDPYMQKKLRDLQVFSRADNLLLGNISRADLQHFNLMPKFACLCVFYSQLACGVPGHLQKNQLWLLGRMLSFGFVHASFVSSVTTSDQQGVMHAFRRLQMKLTCHTDHLRLVTFSSFFMGAERDVDPS